MKRIKNKKIAGLTSPSRTEQRFGVILENIDSKVDLLIEGHQVLDKKIDKVDGKVDDLKKEMDYKFEVVFEKFDEIDVRFEKVDEQFKKIDGQFSKIDEQFGEVKDELRVIRNELKEKVSHDEFVLLEKRVLKLEKARG